MSAYPILDTPKMNMAAVLRAEHILIQINPAV